MSAHLKDQWWKSDIINQQLVKIYPAFAGLLLWNEVVTCHQHPCHRVGKVIEFSGKKLSATSVSHLVGYDADDCPFEPQTRITNEN